VLVQRVKQIGFRGKRDQRIQTGGGKGENMKDSLPVQRKRGFPFIEEKGEEGRASGEKGGVREEKKKEKAQRAQGRVSGELGSSGRRGRGGTWKRKGTFI